MQENCRYDKNVNGNSFKIGDNILLFNEAVKLKTNRKFAPSYHGLYTTMEQIGAINFCIHLVNDVFTGRQEQTGHQNSLKKYLGTTGSLHILHRQTNSFEFRYK